MTLIGSERPTVLTDMDNVEADFDLEVSNRIALNHPEIPIVTDRKNFYISSDYPEHIELVRAISDEKGFFSSLPLMDGAIKGWARMIEAGYKPRICSSPISTNPYSKEEKQGWLEEHFVPTFGYWVVDQAIITKNKEEFEGIALIDDRPKLENADRATWQHIIFDRPYNKANTQPRLYGWNDSNLLKLLNAAAIRFSKR